MHTLNLGLSRVISPQVKPLKVKRLIGVSTLNILTHILSYNKIILEKAGLGKIGLELYKPVEIASD